MVQWPEEIPREEFTRLYFVEKTLRWLIRNQLSSLSKDWWEKRVPYTIQRHARMNKRREKGISKDDLHPIFYIFFRDYLVIMKNRDNWSRCFKLLFRLNEFESLLMDLSTLRNKIAHMRPLNPKEKEKLEDISKQILEPIWKHTCNDPFIFPANELKERGKYQEAEMLLKEGLRKTGKDPWIAFHLGELYITMGKTQKAINQLEHAEKFLPLPNYKNKVKELLKLIRK